MKCGAYIDHTEFVQPCIMLLLNFFSDNWDKEESQGSFKPLNLGLGWINETQKSGEDETGAYWNRTD